MNIVSTEDAQGMDAWLCTMHYVGLSACLSALASSPPHGPYNTCIWSLGINFPLVKFHLHLPKVCTHVSVKVAGKLGAALDTAASENFSPSVSYLPPLLPVSLFIPSYVPSLFLFLLYSFALSQRKALTPRLLPSLHCQLFFYFSWWWEAGIERGRVKKREWVRSYSVLPPSVSVL